MGYFNDKQKLAIKAQNHIKEMELYSESIAHSIENSMIYIDRSSIENFKPMFNTKVCVVKSDSVSAAIGMPDDVCVLNFASFKHPGGMFLEGSSAQEECLCHTSTLYNVLKSFENTYYKYNKSNLNKGLYLNRCIYSKDILFIKDGITKTCDVITCAAPNSTTVLRYNPNMKSETKKAYYNRVDFILSVAVLNGVRNLILGAFGCGVFGNKPGYAASVFKELLSTRYKGCFENVVFPIPDDRNYGIFNNIINGVV